MSASESAPIRSMTGFALARGQSNAGEISVSLRSVNHRGLDLHFHQNGGFIQFENAMRTLLKQHIGRGHVEVRTALSRNSGNEALGYNRELLSSYIALFRQASEEFQIKGELDLNALFAIPGILGNGNNHANSDNNIEGDVMRVLAESIAQLNDYREREGAELRRTIEQELSQVEEQTQRISQIRMKALPHFLQKLRDRLSELLKDSSIPQNRLMEEAALLADRSDVQEELIRLTVHAQELRRVVSGGGEAGKRLDFLLQEMNRETNTILSKTSGIGDAGLTITELGLAIKVNIERMREQALNLE